MGIGSCDHTIHEHQHHHVWDLAQPPALEVDDGASVEFDTTDASGGQLGPSSSAADLANVDFARVNPVTGPVYVLGARPGDVLEVEVLELAMSGWGWTALIPGFGLLAEQYTEPWLKHWDLTPGARTAAFADSIDVPIAPFPGTIGLAPPTPGPHPTVPPHAWGGNLDTKHLTAGTKLYLPVGVEGALFSVGDTHAAQGDGEVCGTAIESRMRIALRFRLRRDLRLRFPAFETFGAAPGDRATSGSFVTTGVGPDLMGAARDAVSGMIDRLMATTRLDADEAYALCSVAVDIRVHEVVDAPNWVVGAWLPHGVVRG
ncbi:MAG: acetamidase [Trueperaceae bacterium]|nr:MAG: acetamidase [Trueperaceae bacterium]